MQPAGDVSLTSRKDNISVELKFNLLGDALVGLVSHSLELGLVQKWLHRLGCQRERKTVRVFGQVWKRSLEALEVQALTWHARLDLEGVSSIIVDNLRILGVHKDIREMFMSVFDQHARIVC